MWGAWQARIVSDTANILNVPKAYVAQIELHFLRHSAEDFLHVIEITTMIKDELEIDRWRANLDVTEDGSWVTSPRWDFETFFANGAVLPTVPVEHTGNHAVNVVTAWHTLSPLVAQRFELWR